MHDHLFEHQDALDRDSLVVVAELGLNSERFAREFDDDTHTQRF